jgi:hypothetical protein
MTLRAIYVAPLVAVGAVFAASGFADQLMTNYNEPAAEQTTMAPSDATAPIPAAEDSTANAEVVKASTEPAAAPIAYEPVAVQPVADTSSSTTVYGQRRTEDEFITDDVVKALSAEQRLSGKIGVDTYRRVVTLTGRVSTQGQVDRVTRVAQRAVDRDVEIRNQVISNV